MKKGFITLFLLFASVGYEVSAQSLEAYKERLAQLVASISGGVSSIVVNEVGDAADAVARASQNTRTRFNGYRIGVFFDNGQNARANAMSAMGTFTSHFPEVKVRVVYENPYFRVLAGNCVTMEEAIILLGRIKGIFPKAYIMRGDMAVTDIVK